MRDYSVAGGPWIRIPGALSQIDTGYCRTVWGRNRYHQVWKLHRNRRSWRKVDGRLMHVSSGEGGVWGVSKSLYIYYRWGKNIVTVAAFFVLLLSKII